MRTTRTLFVATVLSILVGVVGSGATASEGAPSVDEPGPFAVGYQQFEADLSVDQLAKVWYPSVPGSGNIVEAYWSFDVDLFLPQTVVREHATPVDEGPYPIVVQVGSFGISGWDFAMLAERLASHGFIVVSHDNAVNPGADPSACITQHHDAEATLAALHDLADVAEIADFDRVGLYGQSAWGNSAINLAAGNPGLGLEALPGVRTVTAFEGGAGGNCLISQAAPVDAAVMWMGGSAWDLRIGPGDGIGEIEAAYVASPVIPKYYIDRPATTHLGYATNLCQFIDGALTSTISDLQSWAFVFLYFDWFGPFMEGFRMTCNNPAYPDASALYDPSDYPVEGVVPVEHLTQATDTIHFTLAFNLVHLAGDPRYQNLLAPGYVRSTANDSNGDSILDASLIRERG